MGDNSKGIILSSGSVFTPASTYDEVKAAEYMARLLRADHVYTTASDFYQYISALSLRLKPILQAVLSDLRHAGNNIEVIAIPGARVTHGTIVISETILRIAVLHKQLPIY